jgi:hypothetical protein
LSPNAAGEEFLEKAIFQAESNGKATFADLEGE